jgi:hypothetical protein
MHWPGWNSLQAVTRIHDVLQLGSIALSALLVVTGWASHRYSGRQKELEELRAASEKADADRRVQTAEEAAARADSRAAALEGRHVTPEQREALGRLLATVPGGRVEILSGDTESLAYANELASAVRAAGWTVVSRSGLGSLDYVPHTGNELGFMGAASATDPATRESITQLPPGLVPPTGRVLAEALKAAGIETRFFAIEGGERGKMLLFIGLNVK